jgi:hypothetical protein
MPAQRFARLEQIENRHPGLCRHVEAMLRAFIPLRAIAAAVLAQYGERIGYASLATYKWECWSVWRAEGQAIGH